MSKLIIALLLILTSCGVNSAGGEFIKVKVYYLDGTIEEVETETYSHVCNKRFDLLKAGCTDCLAISRCGVKRVEKIN